MAKSKDPKQRSATSDPAAQPTGEEVYKTPASSAAEDAELSTQGTPTSEHEELREVAAKVRRQAAQIYVRSQAYAGERTAPIVGGAFVVGLLIGLLLGRD